MGLVLLLPHAPLIDLWPSTKASSVNVGHLPLLSNVLEVIPTNMAAVQWLQGDPKHGWAWITVLTMTFRVNLPVLRCSECDADQY
jgi:hypothetical protein